MFGRCTFRQQALRQPQNQLSVTHKVNAVGAKWIWAGSFSAQATITYKYKEREMLKATMPLKGFHEF